MLKLFACSFFVSYWIWCATFSTFTSPKLFTTFWTLTAYDIYVPTKAYEREIDKLHKLAQQLDETRESGEAKRKREREQKLLDEQRRQAEHVNRVRLRLMAEADQWFPSGELCFSI